MDSNDALKRRARLALSGNWGTAIIIMLILSAINIGINYIGGKVSSIQTFIFNFSTTSLLTILIAPIIYGSDWAFLNLVREREFKIETIFDPVKIGFMKSILVSLLQWVYIMLWSLLFIIPGIVMGIAYSQVSYILKDQPDLSISEVLALSKKMMMGYKWKFFWLVLSFVGWAILCVATFGIGFIWLSPYIAATLAEFYNNLSGIYYSENGILISDLKNETDWYDRITSNIEE